MGIGVRLAAGFVIVVALFVVNLVLVGKSFSHLSDNIKQIKGETLPYILTVDEMDTARSEVQQFLTDVSATHDPGGYKDAEESAQRFLAGVEKYKQMYQRENNADDLKKMQGIEVLFNNFYATGKSMAETYVSKGMVAGNVVMETFDKQSESLYESLSTFRKEQVSEANRVAAQTVSDADSTMTIMEIGGLIAVLMATVFSMLITRSINGPIHTMKSTMVDIGKNNDLTRRIQVTSKDEIGQAAQAFNNMVGNIQSTLHEVHDGLDKLVDASRDLSASSHQVATGSAHQSEAASAMAATIEQVTVSINHVSENAHAALLLTRKTGELSTQGGEVIHSAANEIMQIANTVRQASTSIEELGQKSTQISSIVQVIRDIAEQTNLLALNAAIEAARAGEQGRGFAVVADEVRKLAERTSTSTAEISQMIDAIQGTARIAVSNMSETVGQVDNGVSLAQQAGDAINQIKESTEQVVRTVDDISSALSEQSTASNDMAKHVEQVAQMTEENSAAAEETSGAASNLAQLADSMRVAVDRFKC